jgi:hypothetical protein
VEFRYPGNGHLEVSYVKKCGGGLFYVDIS